MLNRKPTVQIAYPLDGATIAGKGVVSSGAKVGRDPTKIVGVDYRVTPSRIPVGKIATGWQAAHATEWGWIGNLDTTKALDGPLKIEARATAKSGARSATSITVNVYNATPDPTPTQPPPPVPGVATWRDMLGVSLTAPDVATLDQVRAAGFRWVRIGWENWGTNWPTDLTAVAQHAQQIGLRVVVCFQLTLPRIYTADLLGTWRACWSRLVTIPGVAAFEIGNEWNNDWHNNVGFWRPYDPTWAMQAQFTIEAVRAAKQANPKAVLITNGLSPYGNGDGGLDGTAQWPQASTARLAALLPADIASGLSGWGNHPYCFPQDPRTPGDKTHPGWYACARQRDVHAELAAHGFGEAPIWDTEWGSIGSQFATELVRAQHFRWYFEEFTAQAKAGVLLGPSFIHTFKDGNSGEATMGLYRADGKTPKAETWAVIQEWFEKPWPGVSLAAALTP